MPRDRIDVEAGLTAKGFRKDCRHHLFFTYFSVDGRKTPVYTKTSHGMREISDALIACMAKQCKLVRRNFLQLIDCPLDRDAYERKLKDEGHI
jgi:hypothetical protein